MKIRHVAHKGLRRFIERDDASGLPAVFVERRYARSSPSSKTWMEFEEASPDSGLAGPSTDRRSEGYLGVSTVGRDWRITFRIDSAENEIVDLDYEDYRSETTRCFAWHDRPTPGSSSVRR